MATDRAARPAGDGPVAEGTGHAAVDAALRALDGLADVPVAAHVDIYEDLHDALSSALDTDTED